MAAMPLQSCGNWTQPWQCGQRLGHATQASTQSRHSFFSLRQLAKRHLVTNSARRIREVCATKHGFLQGAQVRGAPPRFGSFNGFFNTGHSRSGRSKKQRTTGIARAEIRNSQPVAVLGNATKVEKVAAHGTLFVKWLVDSVAGIVESVKWAFMSLPPTWESAAIATTVIFVAGAPVMLAGLSLSGYSNAFILALLVWRAFGGQGTLIVSLYFILGTAATKVKIKQKEAAGIAEKKSGRRGPGSVWGSGTAGALCAVATIARLGGFQWTALWKLGFVASFCTKLSDTISSEIGKAYGKTTYLVTTLSIVPRGKEGAVSLEGTLAGLVASVILAAFAVYIKLIDQTGATICVFAAQVANLCESYVGAALQGRQGYEWITNDIANILNIGIGASLAILLKRLTG